MKKFSIALIMAIALTGNASAAGDAQAGKDKAAMCVACHGADGNSNAPNWPNLAGQHEGYIVKQLKNFKEDKRIDPTMKPMVAGLDDQAMQDIAAYFSQQKLKPGQADPDMLEMGKAIYKGGIKDINVPACMACHGPTGAGNPGSLYPQLASQKSDYTEKQLKDFRAAAQNPNQDSNPVGRYNDTNRMMRNAVMLLNDYQIKAVAQYIQGLQP